MSRRIDIELTSSLDDGTWTWRAAGARQPKGVLDGAILPSGSKVGDELKVEAEQEIDGLTVLSVIHAREKQEPELLVLLPVEREFQPVIETKARRERGERPPRRDDGDRRPRRDGDGRGRGAGDRPRSDRPANAGPDDRSGKPRRERSGATGGAGAADGTSGSPARRRDGGRERRGPSFTPPPEIPQRPKPKRLRPGKTHRTAVLADLPPEQRPIAELALQGLGAVRTRVREENERAVTEGRATMPEASVVKMAEDMLPTLRVAEWLDRAEAAKAQAAELDLRDLRSVVAASGDPIVARDESTRVLSDELKQLLATKQDQELQFWFGDIDAALAVGRVIRALRLSSQPPKAGVPFPVDIAQRLVDSTNASLAPMDAPDRWVAMLEAAAFSPVRAQIKPIRKPDVVNDELTATVTRLAPALPQVAALFEIEVSPKAHMPKPLRPTARTTKPGAKPSSKPGSKPAGKPGETSGRKPRPPRDEPKQAEVVEAPVVEAPVVEAPVVEAPVVEAPVAEAEVVAAAVVETEVVQAPVVEAEVVETAVIEAPVVEPEVVEAVVVETPAVGAPVAEAEVVEAAAVETEVVEAPAAKPVVEVVEPATPAD